jgi:hypothetical protein
MLKRDHLTPRIPLSTTIVSSLSMSFEAKQVTEETPKDAPSPVPETKDVAQDVSDAPASVPDTSLQLQGGEDNYLDDSPHTSQKASDTPRKAGAKTTAKSEASATTGEKRQRR